MAFTCIHCGVALRTIEEIEIEYCQVCEIAREDHLYFDTPDEPEKGEPYGAQAVDGEGERRAW